ncbi:hypothetical protein NXS19_006039 [Fusarium pseudograminearum]|nr:hypothetical protein NXS19_006039 [Fusarium pseudograminearum]
MTDCTWLAVPIDVTMIRRVNDLQLLGPYKEAIALTGADEKPGNNIRRINMETDTQCSDEIPQHKIDQHNDAIGWIKEMESLVGAESCPQVTLVEVLPDPAQSWREILSLCLRRG